VFEWWPNVKRLDLGVPKEQFANWGYARPQEFTFLPGWAMAGIARHLPLLEQLNLMAVCLGRPGGKDVGMADFKSLKIVRLT